VALDNLVDFIIICASDPAAANELFLVSDGEDLSTPDLIRRIGTALGHNARLMPCPVAVLEALARVVGLGEISTRLLGTLCLDIGKAERVLNWQPPICVNEGLHRAAAEFHDMTE
jgi:nucleoside-diphosphate-sugar epimerase